MQTIFTSGQDKWVICNLEGRVLDL